MTEYRIYVMMKLGLFAASFYFLYLFNPNLFYAAVFFAVASCLKMEPPPFKETSK